MYPTKTIVRTILEERELAPNKKLGQNFLIDQAMAQKIVSSLELSKDDSVLEVGPGLGALTYIAAQQCQQLTAVEIDKGYAQYLNDIIIKKNITNIKIINEDAIKRPFQEHVSGPFKLVGNWPYSVTGPLLMNLLEARERVSVAVIMMQKEVVQKLFAPVKTNDYNRISVYFQLVANIKLIATVPRQCFYPQPKVDSSVVKIVLKRSDLSQSVWLETQRLVQCVFQQKRKAVGKSLKQIAEDHIVQAALSDVHIDPTLRPHEISPEQYAQLAQAFQERTK